MFEVRFIAVLALLAFCSTVELPVAAAAATNPPPTAQSNLPAGENKKLLQQTVSDRKKMLNRILLYWLLKAQAGQGQR